jgi:hypothetical protein
VPTTTYSATQLLPNGYVKGPPFTNYFNYDGVNFVIFDTIHTGTGITPEDYWQMDAAYPIQCLTYSFPGANPPINARSRTWYMDAQFTYLTPAAEARSLYYDITRTDARLIPQILFPTVQPQGTSVTFEWQGCKANAGGTIDLSTQTAWLPDVRALSNYRFIRFHATFVNNTSARTIASIDRLTVPFTYR